MIHGGNLKRFRSCKSSWVTGQISSTHSQRRRTVLKATAQARTHILTALSQPEEDICGNEKKIWFTVGGAKLVFFFSFCSFSWHWIVSLSRWLKTPSTAGRQDVSLRVQKVFTGVFKSHVFGCFAWGRWTSRSAPSVWPKKEKKRKKRTVPSRLPLGHFNRARKFNRNCFRDDQSQSNVPLGHPYWVFFSFFFLMCMKLLDGDEDPSQPWSGEYGEAAPVLLSICF